MLIRPGAVRSPLGRVMYALVALTSFGSGLLVLYSVVTGGKAGGMGLVLMGVSVAAAGALLIRRLRRRA